jgi:hypothetical protein
LAVGFAGVAGVQLLQKRGIEDLLPWNSRAQSD